MSISLIIPCCGGNVANFQRTADSAKGVCDEVVAITTCLFDEDLEAIRTVANKVVELPWNYTFLHGFGDMHNQASDKARNDWLILLGVGETIHSGHEQIRMTLPRAPIHAIHQAWHVNDPNRWSRAWNRRGGPRWGGIIHETVRGGQEAGVLFEMRDTDKVPSGDKLRDEAMRYLKTCLYNHLYQKLLNDNSLLGYTDPGWINFVNGARESITAFCHEHEDLISCAIAGDRERFIATVFGRIEAKLSASGVNFNPQGEPKTGNETIP